MYDLIIIGAGPAGLSAAIHAKRFDLNFVVLERGRVGGQALAANLIRNYPGFPDGISGCELMQRFAEQAQRAGVEIKKCEVKRVCHPPEKGDPDDTFTVTTSEGTIEARSVIVATGLTPIRDTPARRGCGGRYACPPPPKAEAPLAQTGQWREVRLPAGGVAGGAIYYPVPADVPHAGKRVLVIGGGDAAFDEAISFSEKAAGVTIAMRSKKPKALSWLVDRALKFGVLIKDGLTEDEIADIGADVVVACIGKERDLSILDPSLKNVLLAGDVLHPAIRHIALAVGDGVSAVEKTCR